MRQLENAKKAYLPERYAYQNDKDPKVLPLQINFSGFIIALGVRMGSLLKY